jgi:hypothetical protein
MRAALWAACLGEHFGNDNMYALRYPTCPMDSDRRHSLSYRLAAAGGVRTEPSEPNWATLFLSWVSDGEARAR